MIHRRLQSLRRFWAAVGAVFCLAGVAYADEDKSGVSPNTIAVPKGPGSVQGLGESFQPTLNTGTAKYAVGLAVPPGTAGHTPTLSLAYEGGRGNGAFGIGWRLSPPFIQRQTDKGIPRYIDANNGLDDDGDGTIDDVGELDLFINDAGEELVAQANGDYFCKNEGAFIRYRKSGSGWVATQPDGTRLEFGLNAAARVEVGGRVFSWQVERIIDTDGNVIQFTWAGAAGVENLNQKFLQTITYGPGAGPWSNYHLIRFNYEPRPDWFEDGRSGFLVRTGQRVANIAIGTHGPTIAGHAQADLDGDAAPDNLVRRYELAYTAHIHWSLLTTVTPVGADGVSTLPPSTFDYNVVSPAATLSATGKILGGISEPSQAVDNALVEFVDLNGDALPDLLKTDQSGGTHTGFLNLGESGPANDRDISWSDANNILSDDGLAWNINLESTETVGYLADMDADGMADLVYRSPADDFYYFKNKGNQSWGPRTHVAAQDSPPPAAPCSCIAVRTADVNFDKRIDIIQSISTGSSADYRVWLNLGGDKYAKQTTVSQTEGLDFMQSGVEIIDFNGDRVTDIVRIRSNQIDILPGLGYGNFAARATANIPDYTLLGDDIARAKLRDINGDGFTDLVVERAAPGELWYWLNNGNYTLDTRRVITDMPTVTSPDAAVRWADMNGNGTTDIVYADSTNLPRMQTVDLGALMGFVPAPNLLTRINNGIGRITQIEYATSSQFAIADHLAGDPWPTPLPFPVEVVSRVVNQDSLGDAYVTQFAYHDGYYDASERQFRGFARVEMTEVGDTSAPTLITHHEFDTGATVEAMKGKLLRQSAETATAEVFWDETTNWTAQTLMTGVNGDDVVFARPNKRLRDVIERGVGTPHTIETRYTFDQYGNQTELYEYGIADGGNLQASNDERVTITSYAINTTDWLLRFPAQVELRDYVGTVIKRTQTYYDDETFSATNLGSVAKGHPTLTRALEDPAAITPNWLLSSRTKFDAFGNPTQLLDPLADATAGVVDDAVGHYRTIAYDPLFRAYATTETIHVGGGSADLLFTATYNEAFGTILSATEFNGHVSSFGYDTHGRLTSVRKPGDTPGYPSAEYAYTLAEAVPGGRLINYVETRVLDTTPGSSGLAQRDHYFISRDFVDGLGRKVLHKEEADPVSSAPRVALSGAVTFNARMQPAAALNPCYTTLTGNLDACLAFEYISAVGWQGRFHDNGNEQSLAYNSAFKTTTNYDALLRAETTNNPDGTFARTEYRPLLTRAFDENDTQPTSDFYDTPMLHYNDGLDRLVRVDETSKLNDDGTRGAAFKVWTTRYQYRADDVLTRIIDSQDNEKELRYDGLGRKTYMDDPDRGHMTYAYDATGNLVRTVDAKAQEIRYTYDGANRILTEDYRTEGLVGPPTPEVEYHYDTAVADLPQGDNTKATALNVLGKLAWVKDESGEEHSAYDPRGNLLYTVKRIPEPITGVLVSYKTAMTYDPADRVRQLVYPDKDDCTYHYTARGQVDHITGGALHNLNGTDRILTHIDYLASGQQREVGYGNGVITTYNYDRRQRMAMLHTARTADPAYPLLSYAYQFDPASNITAIDDLRNPATAPDGDPMRNTQRFQYDDLYRLTRVQYSFTTPGAPLRDDGHIDYRYDRIGNMLAQTSNIVQEENGLSVTNLGNMAYGGASGRTGRIGRAPADPPGPHALTSADNTASGGDDTRAYPYDANGNMTQIDGLTCTWDFQDRLVQVDNATMRAFYTYDYTGRRISKKVFRKVGTTPETFPDLTTLYINKFFEVREGGQPTKYVFNGDTRIARIIGTLNPAAQRVQRIPLSTGWNLIALCVDAPDAATQLGIGTDPALTQAFRWDAQSTDYIPITPATPLPVGTILWLNTTAHRSLSLQGSYVEPGNATVIPDGDRLATSAALLALNTQSSLASITTNIATFDNNAKDWLHQFEFPFATGAPNTESLSEWIPVGTPIALRALRVEMAANPGVQQRVGFYCGDQLGSASVLIDGEGLQQERNAFLPFGAARIKEAPASPAIIRGHYGFVGNELDQESGLGYFEARYYPQVFGRFISTDPLLLFQKSGHKVSKSSDLHCDIPGALNPYLYARANPLGFSDPSGWDSKRTVLDDSLDLTFGVIGIAGSLVVAVASAPLSAVGIGVVGEIFAAQQIARNGYTVGTATANLFKRFNGDSDFYETSLITAGLNKITDEETAKFWGGVADVGLDLASPLLVAKLQKEAALIHSFGSYEHVPGVASISGTFYGVPKWVDTANDIYGYSQTLRNGAIPIIDNTGSFAVGDQRWSKFKTSISVGK
jgi:RHS repeat-associated protein